MASAHPKNVDTEVNIDPPHINQNARNGYIALNIRSWRGSLLNKIGAKATRSNTVAKFGLQYSDDGYLKP